MTQPFSQARGPNDVWCADFKGWFARVTGIRLRSADDQRCAQPVSVGVATLLQDGNVSDGKGVAPVFEAGLSGSYGLADGFLLRGARIMRPALSPRKVRRALTRLAVSFVSSASGWSGFACPASPQSEPASRAGAGGGPVDSGCTAPSSQGDLGSGCRNGPSQQPTRRAFGDAACREIYNTSAPARTRWARGAARRALRARNTRPPIPDRIPEPWYTVAPIMPIDDM